MRRRLCAALCFIALGPIAIIYMLRQALQACVDFLDWTTEGRAWTTPFVGACEWIERRFGYDAESEHQRWQERMEDVRIVSRKECV